MAYARLRKGLTDLNAPQLLTKAASISQNLAEDPVFTNPTPSLSELDDAISALQTAVLEAIDGGVTAMAIRRAREAELRSILDQLAGYVTIIAKGDEVIIRKSGFGVVEQGSPAPEPTAPLDVRVAMSDHVGRVDVRWNAVAVAVSYHIQYSPDAMDETLWKLVAVSTRGTAKVTGLPSGQVAYFRIAGIGTAGMGPWSQVASTLVK